MYEGRRTSHVVSSPPALTLDPVRLYLVRHGQARADDGSYGHDTPLSPLGRRQAEAVAVGLANASLVPPSMRVRCAGHVKRRSRSPA